MATTKTYTLVNGQPADATQVNKNFDDLLAGINADVSATDKVLGRATAGAGPVEEIPCTAAGRALLDDATAAVQLTTLGAMPSAAGTVTLAQMANLGKDLIIGRAYPSTGVPEQIACTAAGRAILDDANAAAQIATLGAVATGDSRLSDARVASDVSAWAKAATAPALFACGGYTGNGAANRAISVGFQPKLVTIMPLATTASETSARIDATDGRALTSFADYSIALGASVVAGLVLSATGFITGDTSTYPSSCNINTNVYRWEAWG